MMGSFMVDPERGWLVIEGSIPLWLWRYTWGSLPKGPEPPFARATGVIPISVLGMRQRAFWSRLRSTLFLRTGSYAAGLRRPLIRSVWYLGP